MANLSLALLLIIVLLLAAHFLEIKKTHRRHD
ncbi:hypothetical protein SAMN05444008_10266 [Cnuella takakiae]|uniref:Uncharacterized protein n=1 Tax=Cnuella takakiae TaxID=1302690 RepID=A0A1M4UW42_9BACT|nr:hypothetical protein SAMN05444008_10266 [Cnuella takakiae]